jgi:hypothetical protein
MKDEHPMVTFTKSLEALAENTVEIMVRKVGEAELRNLQREEHDAWRKLCFMLKTRGVVTEVDLNSPVGQCLSPRSPGQDLLNAIRGWCELRVDLEKAALGRVRK